MKNLLKNNLVFLFLLIVPFFSQESKKFQELDDFFLNEVESLTQATMLKRAEEDARYAQWLKLEARDSAKIKAGDLALAQKVIDRMPKDVLITREVEVAIKKLTLSGNPQVVLLLEAHLKADPQDMWKWLNAERIICELVYFSPELTNFTKLPRESNKPFFLQSKKYFLNEMSMPRSAWIRWFDANKECLLAKKYSEVELFSRYKPIRKKGMNELPFSVYDDDGYEPNSAPIDVEKKQKKDEENVSNSKVENQPVQLKSPATKVSFLWLSVGVFATIVVSCYFSFKGNNSASKK